MSCAWTLHCKNCDRTPIDFEINHGIHVLQSIYKLREPILAIVEQDKSGYLELGVMGHNTSDLWLFLSEHKDHAMELMSEYGKPEPIEEVPNG